MKKIALFALIIALNTHAQQSETMEIHQKAIHALIDSYATAREKKDTLLLKKIITDDIDQLVSNGVWRRGTGEAIAGMLQSSNNNPGKRTLTIDEIRFLNADTGIVDARYVISQSNGTARRMWSTFIVVLSDGQWKITAMRNMLPTGQQ